MRRRHLVFMPQGNWCKGSTLGYLQCKAALGARWYCDRYVSLTVRLATWYHKNQLSMYTCTSLVKQIKGIVIINGKIFVIFLYFLSVRNGNILHYIHTNVFLGIYLYQWCLLFIIMMFTLLFLIFLVINLIY